MANIISYEVGTGASKGKITGAKTSFAHDEQIWGAHKWENIKEGTVLEITWLREVNGKLQEENKKIVSCNNGDGSYWQNAWIKDFPAGKWTAWFGRDGIVGNTREFTIKPKEEEYPKSIKRDEISLLAFNVEQEIKLKEFLGIDPPGINLSDYLATLNEEGIDNWARYWNTIAEGLDMKGLRITVKSKADYARSKLEPYKPTWPKTITRAPLSFSAGNIEEEKQLREFLGIEPVGIPLDDYLSLRSKAELDNWEKYWNIIWPQLGRTDLMSFTSNKADEYRAKIIPEPEPELTWFDKFLLVISGTDVQALIGEKSLFQKGFELLTGIELTKELYEEKEQEMIEYIVPSNTIHKLFTGLNLKGEPEEFGSAEDWMDIIFLAAAIIPAGKVAGTGAKLTLAKISSREAGELAAKFGVKATVAKLLKIVKANPETSAKFLSRFPAEVRNAVIAGLGKTSYGREMIFTLGKTGYFKYTASGWSRIMSGAFKFGAISAGVFLPIFAITEIPNYFNMRTFARKSIAQTLGEYAPDFSFQINEFEKSLATITYELENNIKELQYDAARENLILLENVVNNYITYIEEKKEIMFEEDYKLSLDLIEFYRRLITDRRDVVGEKPTEPRPVEPVPDEDKWEKIREEQELWQEEQLRKKEEYYRKLFEEMEKQKEQDVIEQQEYWDNILAEREAAKESERIADEEYWARLEEQRRIAEEEKRISEEEYWERLYEQEQLREAEKRLADEAYWQTIYAQQEARKAKTGTTPTTWSPTPYTRKSYSAPIYPTLKPADYSLIYSTPSEYGEFEAPAIPEKRELLINIETTSLMPFEGRIYSIAIQDLSRPELAPMILTSNNEVELIKNFLMVFERGNYSKIVGYNTVFDYRFIFTKMMQHRIRSSKFYYADLVDVMQIMKQVKEAFVFGFNKPGKLDDWGKMILGKGKYSDQETMLKRYISGDFEFVGAFQERQLELTKELYDLARFVQSASVETSESSIPETISAPFVQETEQPLTNLPEKKCFNCFQVNPAGTTECIVCGTKL